jgi:hypothetical protein
VEKRNFEPMRRQVEMWQQTQITDEKAKLGLDAKPEAAVKSSRSMS